MKFSCRITICDVKLIDLDHLSVLKLELLTAKALPTQIRTYFYLCPRDHFLSTSRHIIFQSGIDWQLVCHCVQVPRKMCIHNPSFISLLKCQKRTIKKVFTVVSTEIQDENLLLRMDLHFCPLFEEVIWYVPCHMRHPPPIKLYVNIKEVYKGVKAAGHDLEACLCWWFKQTNVFF